MALYCVLPVVTLLSLTEAAIRWAGYDRPLAGSIFFGNPGSNDPIHRADAELFYSLKPNIRARWQGATVSTNRLGLRSPEIDPKQPGEFRILSLGESSTFGANVEDAETYSAQLEKLLSANDSQHLYRAINAGVSGYTSFQSLKYLTSRGLKLQPDLVLFYHEQNDALPAAYSDRELYESQTHAWHRELADWSAVYRVISNALARRKIEAQRGLFSIGTRRVPLQEQWKNLQELEEVCRSHGIALVIIHPAYADSVPHTCVLTKFCKQTGVKMYEAQTVLHPSGRRKRELFADECHPNPEGHKALARGLFRFLNDSALLPRGDGPTIWHKESAE